uniref:Uncharacterized protein n=1 Tax=Oryza sativa subsp. indica TaxID=39946 RepID=A0A679BCM7_ORYSI|nr:unknown protein [Oryza sativa Indica Group]
MQPHAGVKTIGDGRNRWHLFGNDARSAVSTLIRCKKKLEKTKFKNSQKRYGRKWYPLNGNGARSIALKIHLRKSCVNLVDFDHELVDVVERYDALVRGVETVAVVIASRRHQQRRRRRQLLHAAVLALAVAAAAAVLRRDRHLQREVNLQRHEQAHHLRRRPHRRRPLHLVAGHPREYVRRHRRRRQDAADDVLLLPQAVRHRGDLAVEGAQVEADPELVLEHEPLPPRQQLHPPVVVDVDVLRPPGRRRSAAQEDLVVDEGVDHLQHPELEDVVDDNGGGDLGQHGGGWPLHDEHVLDRTTTTSCCVVVDDVDAAATGVELAVEAGDEQLLLVAADALPRRNLRRGGHVEVDDEGLHLAGVERADGDLAGGPVDLGDGARVPTGADPVDPHAAAARRLEDDARADGGDGLEPAEAQGERGGDLVGVGVVEEGVGALRPLGDEAQRRRVVRGAQAEGVHGVLGQLRHVRAESGDVGDQHDELGAADGRARRLLLQHLHPYRTI